MQEVNAKFGKKLEFSSKQQVHDFAKTFLSFKFSSKRAATDVFLGILEKNFRAVIFQNSISEPVFEKVGKANKEEQ